MADSKTSLAYSLGYFNTDDHAGGTALVTNDAVDLVTNSRALYVGGAGAVKVTMVDDSVLTFSGVAAGTILPIIAKRVWATGTTATLIIALY